MPDGLRSSLARPETVARGCPRAPPARLGPERALPEKPLGRRPHRPGGGRRRRVRSRKPPDPLRQMPPGRHGGIAQAPRGPGLSNSADVTKRARILHDLIAGARLTVELVLDKPAAGESIQQSRTRR